VSIAVVFALCCVGVWLSERFGWVARVGDYEEPDVEVEAAPAPDAEPATLRSVRIPPNRSGVRRATRTEITESPMRKCGVRR
jgi:hypothetical protein